MSGTGTTTINFGAFPGVSDAAVNVTGQAGIIAGSLVEAWLRPEATADHSAEEHLVESIRVIAGSIDPGVGFTIYAFNTNQVAHPATQRNAQEPLLYGEWTVAWAWF